MSWTPHIISLQHHNIILGHNLHNVGIVHPTNHQTLHYPALIEIYKRWNAKEGRGAKRLTSENGTLIAERQVHRKHFQIN